MQLRIILTLLLTMLPAAAALSADLWADDGTLTAVDRALRAQLAQRLNEIGSDPDKYQDALYFGELRSTLCKVCHGPDGNSMRDGTPNLAGQDPVYIVDQLNRYADGRRKDYWMAGLASHFTDEDKLKLAIYYSEQKMIPSGGGNPKLLERGRQLYRQHCTECHGIDGRNREGYARLAGQRPEYTLKMLKEFRSPQGKRFNPLMYARVYRLSSEQDMHAVATYLAHLE